jgi:hypothetical protein
MQPNTNQYSLHIPLHKQLSFTSACWSEEHFMQSGAVLLYTVASALTY